MDAQQSLKPEVSVQSRVFAPKKIWIPTKRPHTYFPHIMVNHCELVTVDEAVDRWHTTPEITESLQSFLNMNDSEYSNFVHGGHYG